MIPPPAKTRARHLAGVMPLLVYSCPPVLLGVIPPSVDQCPRFLAGELLPTVDRCLSVLRQVHLIEELGGG